jgi:hypothetical protein
VHEFGNNSATWAYTHTFGMQSFSDLLDAVCASSNVNFSVRSSGGHCVCATFPGHRNLLTMSWCDHATALAVLDRLVEVAEFEVVLLNRGPQSLSLMQHVAVYVDGACSSQPSRGELIAVDQFPDVGAHVNCHFSPAYFSAVVGTVLRVLEERAHRERDAIVRFRAFGYKRACDCEGFDEPGSDEDAIVISEKCFEAVAHDSLAWAAVRPLVRGVVAASHNGLRALPKDDEIRSLLLDGRLLRTKGSLLSSFMAGAVVRFLPFAPKY